jgi:type II restriction/modification system DNA methylase subunit YeeA
MALSWNEIKDRALRFSKEWENETSEDAEAKSFLDGFFDVFGISRRRSASFEMRVKKGGDREGFIDLLWKGVILIEMKSRGKNLDKAFEQAKNYFPGLKEYDLPKFILVSDFEKFRLYDLEENTQQEFLLKDLYKNVKLFGFILGYQTKHYKEEDPVNIIAAERMGKLHDRLKEIGYDGHALEVYLVRMLFCLFAEDTSIFQKRQFQDYIEQKTAEDGSDLAPHLAHLFYVLNTSEDKRLKNLDEHLKAFPYVNGKLFEEQLPPAGFDTRMRNLLLDCCALDWSKISPAIFGSLFQSVMNPVERRNLGAHYTSEKNILKLIKPLFLDALYKEFEGLKNNKNKLTEFHKKLSKLKFLDPACGCGNFLIITYRELRLLEIEVLRAMNKTGQGWLDVRDIIWLDVDMVYGIEYEEFPARIAEVAMWLIDHQMNMLISEEFGQYFARLPLKKSANIVHGNALQLDWSKLATKTGTAITADVTNVYVEEPALHYETVNVYAKKVNVIEGQTAPQPTFSGSLTYDYILGNPPFIGKKEQKPAQKKDMEKVFAGVKGAGVLDYVAAWYLKAAQLIQNTPTKVAFVSTNSIAQGEQVGILWNLLFNFYHIKIHFAHRTFNWKNEAKGNAAVHVVIVGFASYDVIEKTIYEYENIKGEPNEVKVKNINPYLVEGKDNFLLNRKKPISNVQELNYGSMPIDEGHLIVSDEERSFVLQNEPEIEDLIRPYTGGDEFINNKKRWCLWLKDVNPSIIKSSKFIQERTHKTRKFRLESKREATNKLADYPSLFGEIRQPNTHYIIIPKVSSETRKYIPIGILSPEIIASGSCLIIPSGNLYSFGIMTSLMHMIWMKYTCGKMKSDYQYSVSIVYNNFPWPENPSEKVQKTVSEAAQKVLDVRAEFPNSSLADLYDPLTMPPKLVKAHQELDKSVDLCYRPQAFPSESKRIEYLFELYEKYTAGLFAAEKPKMKKP